MENNKVVLPHDIDLDKSISISRSFNQARLTADDLPRLQESCVRLASDVVADVNFERDLNGMRVVKGVAEADVVLVCQRCGEEFTQHLKAKFRMTPDEERAKASQIENKYDFIDLDEEGKVDLYTLIEDGLLLEIPSIPKHDEDDEHCLRHGTDWSYGDEESELSANPFGALAALKGQLGAQEEK